MLRALTVMLAITMALIANPAAAQEKSSDEILKALTPKKKVRTRGLRRPAAPTLPRSLQQLRGKTRGLSISEREDLAEAVKQGSVPQIDVEILFEFNSDKLNPASKSQLVSLGTALTSSALKDARIIIAGHTDGKGSANYNQQLSERRASSVRGFLVSTFALDATRLIIVGYGEEQLKLPSDPSAAANRRVQILNLGS